MPRVQLLLIWIDKTLVINSVYFYYIVNKFKLVYLLQFESVLSNSKILIRNVYHYSANIISLLLKPIVTDIAVHILVVIFLQFFLYFVIMMSKIFDELRFLRRGKNIITFIRIYNIFLTDIEEISEYYRLFETMIFTMDTIHKCIPKL